MKTMDFWEREPLMLEPKYLDMAFFVKSKRQTQMTNEKGNFLFFQFNQSADKCASFNSHKSGSAAGSSGMP